MAEISLRERIRRKSLLAKIPSEGTFEITPRCTMNCKMCYIVLSESEQKRLGNELTASQWLNLAEQAAKEGLTDLLITGGEPFIRKDFYEILDGISSLGILTRINTNATLIDEKAIERLLKMAPYRFNVTLYGASNETYKRLCGFPGGFDRVSKSIDMMKSAGLEIKLNFTINPLNKQDAEGVKAFAQERGLRIQCANYIFNSVNNDKFDVNTQRVDSGESANIFYETDSFMVSDEWRRQKANEMKNIIEKQKNGDIPFKKRAGMACSGGKNNFWITWQGKMYPCAMMKLCETEPLKTGFKAAWDHIKHHVEDIKLPEKCSNCEYGYFCSICAAQIYGETGNTQKISPDLCEWSKANACALLKYSD